jgi:hypothetical protein
MKLTLSFDYEKIDFYNNRILLLTQTGIFDAGELEYNTSYHYLDYWIFIVVGWGRCLIQNASDNFYTQTVW